MTLAEIKQKDIQKGDIFQNAVNGHRMLVKVYEKHNEPSIGHYSVLVQEHVPGEIKLIPKWYNDVNAFGKKLESADSKNTRSVSKSQNQSSISSRSEKSKERQTSLKENDEQFPDPIEEFFHEVNEVSSRQKVDRNQAEDDVPKDPADEFLEEDKGSNL